METEQTTIKEIRNDLREMRFYYQYRKELANATNTTTLWSFQSVPEVQMTLIKLCLFFSFTEELFNPLRALIKKLDV